MHCWNILKHKFNVANVLYVAADDDVDNLEVNSEDFQVALNDLVPSVPVEELKRYENLHSTME